MTKTRRAVLAGLAALAVGVVAGPVARAAAAAAGPPVVSTGQAGGVAQSAATLTGAIDTQGFETVYEFDLGVDTSYGTRIFGDAGMEPGTQTFMSALQGLAPGTTYHYRIVATNAFGTGYGVDETFTTASYPSAALSVPVAPSLVPAILLAPAPSVSTAKAASRPAAHAAGHGRAGAGGGRPRGHKLKGRRPGGSGRAHGASRGGGK
ncbi:MAG: fibronectin type III domain-containing protein [Solirubrobacteraceae bacterium]